MSLKAVYKCSCPPPKLGEGRIISGGCQIHGVKAGEYEQEYSFEPLPTRHKKDFHNKKRAFLPTDGRCDTYGY